jgi:hypothetical protein
MEISKGELWLRNLIRAEVGRMAQEHDTVFTPGNALDVIKHLTDRIDQLEELLTCLRIDQQLKELELHTHPRAPKPYPNPPIDTPETPVEYDYLANHQKSWSAAEDERLRGEFKVFVAEAAMDHQRSLDAVQVRLSKLRVVGSRRS